LTTQITKLQKSNKENPIKMMELQNGLERVTAELLSQELELMQFKRVTLKEAFDAKFDAMLEYSEKMALIAGYGRAITLVIDTETQVADRMRIYTGAEYTAGAVNQVKAAVTQWQPQPMNSAPARAHSVMSQDELALSAAATAYNTKTPPKTHSYVSSQSPPQGYASGHDPSDASQGNLQVQAASPIQDPPYLAPPQSTTTHAQQLSHIQDQQRQLELEQQRLYQQNLASYSPERSPSQLHYQIAAGGGGAPGPASGGYTPGMPQRSSTQELHPSPGNLPTYGGYSQYDNSTYASAAPARNYRLGFVDPRERNQMDNADMYKTEVHPNGRPALPPLHFSQSPIIMHEK
jgi:hypothetical protein